MVHRPKLYILVLLLVFLSYRILQYDGFDTVSIIESYGYGCEIHYITTEDGYILTYHRIPPRHHDSTKKTPILLMHGLLETSAVFVLLGPDRGLGFILADLGYDVWLGNHRGNAYSKNHTTLDPAVDSAKFYNFSCHEIGYYDIPTAVDYILNVTKVKNLHYVGMSLGTTSFLVMGSTRPEYNDKIKLASLLAPAVYVSVSRNFLGALCQNENLLVEISKVLHEIPLVDFLRRVVPPLCSTTMVSFLCAAVCGFSSGSVSDAFHNRLYMPRITANNPSNTAMKELTHLCQQIVRGEFVMFDYGPTNTEIYNSTAPPQYNLSKVLAPVALYYAQNDQIIPVKNRDVLASRLPNLIENYLVPSDAFGHSSFIFSRNVVELLYHKLLDTIYKY